MIKKSNLNNDSTANIFDSLKEVDSLKEEELPDALLSPDSLVRKKRDMQRFNDLLCAGFIQAMKIRNLMIAHWKALIKKAALKFDLEREDFQDKLTNLKLMVIQQKQLSIRQLVQIEAIKSWFRHLIEKIDNKIGKLEQTIQWQNSQIQRLKQSRTETCTALLQVWQEQTNKLPDHAMLRIPLDLFPPYLSKAEETSIITFNAIEQKNLLSQIGESLQNAIFSLDLNGVILDKILPFVRQKLNEAWSFLPIYERESAIDRSLREPHIQALLTEHIIALVSHAPLLKHKINELHALDLALAQIMAETEVNITYLNTLVSEKALLKEKLNEFDSFVEPKTRDIANQTDNKIADKIMNAKDALNYSLAAEEKNFLQMLSSIKQFSLEADNLLAEIDSHFDEIFQVENLEQLPNLEEKGATVAATVQQFIQNTEQQEETVFAISNQPKL